MFPCPKCEFMAKSKGGLTSHVRNRHKAQSGDNARDNARDDARDDARDIERDDNVRDIERDDNVRDIERDNIVVDDTFMCPECKKTYGSQVGLFIHRRRAHPDNYHREKQPAVRVKARWSHEELVLLARAEIELRNSGYKGGINQALLVKFPQRTLESIKGVRNKKLKYTEILRSLTSESTINMPDNVPTPDPIMVDTNIPDNAKWSDELLNAIEIEYLKVNDLNWVRPGVPNAEVRAQLDIEYAAWIEGLGSNNIPRTRVRSSTSTNNEWPVDGRRRRKQQYSYIQNLFGHNKTSCADKVLDGSWRNANNSRNVTFENMTAAWVPIFEKASVADSRDPGDNAPMLWEIIRPVTVDEVKNVLSSNNKSASGPDGINIHAIKKLSMNALCSHFNLWLLSGSQPSALCTGRSIFIPKEHNTMDPLVHRPLTIASNIIRVFHKILARRMEASLPLRSSQKGFRRGDGIAQHIWTLRAIIDNAKTNINPLNLVFLDIKKAFDSVSHETILLALRRMGVPPVMISYVRDLYSRSTTIIEHDGKSSEPVKVNQGVKQGDPLSPLIFNTVIDWALSALDNELGYDFNGLRINNLAYADDVILISETKAGISNLLRAFEKHLLEGGLAISSGVMGKSKSMSIVVDGKAKRWVVDSSEHLCANGQSIPAMSSSSEYKYLGIYVTAAGAKIRDSLRKDFTNGLSNISKAPLKPQQRLYILQNHFIPKFLHQLVLAPVSSGWLRWLDNSIRSAVRSWLKLPHDTARSFLHAKVKDGGLGVPSLRFSIPTMKKVRLENMLGSVEPIVKALVGGSFYRQMLIKWSRPLSVEGYLVSDRESISRAWANSLYVKLDGRGLSESSQCKEANFWVSCPPKNQSGARYMGAVKARGGVLYSKVRASRGRPDRDISCDACLRPESAQHMIQVCERTRGPRIKRHDDIVKFVKTAAVKAGYSVLSEPRVICNSLGLRKPDLVIWKDDIATVVDITITSDQVSPNESHRQKVTYYQHPEITEWVIRATGVNEVRYSAVASNWRGVISSCSTTFLKETIRMAPGQISLMGLKICEGSFAIHRFFGRSTFRVGYH